MQHDILFIKLKITFEKTYSVGIQLDEVNKFMLCQLSRAGIIQEFFFLCNSGLARASRTTLGR